MRSRFMLCWLSFFVAAVAVVTKTKLTEVQFSDQMFLFLSRWSTLQPRPLFSKFRTHRRRRTTRATRWNNETEARTIMWKKAEQTNFTKKVIFSVPSLFYSGGRLSSSSSSLSSAVLSTSNEIPLFCLSSSPFLLVVVVQVVKTHTREIKRPGAGDDW